MVFAQALSLRSKLSSWSCEHLVCLRHQRQPLSSAALRWIPADCRWGTTGHPWMLPAIGEGEEGLFDRPLRYCWPTPPGTPAEVQAHADLVTSITGTQTDVIDLLPKLELQSSNRVSRERPTLIVVPWGSGAIKNLTGELIAGVVKDTMSEPKMPRPHRRRTQATVGASAIDEGFECQAARLRYRAAADGEFGRARGRDCELRRRVGGRYVSRPFGDSDE